MSIVLTPEALADRWNVPRSQIYRLAREGRLPCVRLGRYVRFSLASVEAFERDGGTDRFAAAPSGTTDASHLAHAGVET